MALPVNSRWQFDSLRALENGNDLLFIEPENNSTEIVFNGLIYETFSVHDQEDAQSFPSHVTLNSGQVSPPSSNSPSENVTITPILYLLLLSDSSP